MLCGVWRSVAGQEAAAAGWPLFGSIAGYATLLAAVVWAIVHWGGVWQDARTLLVTIVLMLVALSMSFDAVAVLDPAAARRFLLLGFVFALGVSEATFARPGHSPLVAVPRAVLCHAGAAVRLSGLAGRTLAARRARALAWSLMLFPTLAAGIFLTLLPVAHLGRSRPKWSSGTPWTWPLFPWTLFFFLALGVGACTYSLSYAFDSGAGGESGFQGYWLAPLLLVGALLLLEMALAAGSRAAQIAATVAPLALAPMALTGAGAHATQERFFLLFRESLGSPAVLTAGMLLGFYAWAWLRKAKLAEAGLMAALIFAAAVNPHTVDWQTLGPLNPAPLGIVLLVQLVLGVRNGASGRMLIVAALLVAAGCWPLRDAALVRSGYLPLHLLVPAAMSLGLLFRDRLARSVARAATYLLPVLALAAVVVYPTAFPQVPMAAHALYAAALAALAAAYWRREPTEAHLATALTTVALVLASALLAATPNWPRRRSPPAASGWPPGCYASWRACSSAWAKAES